MFCMEHVQTCHNKSPSSTVKSPIYLHHLLIRSFLSAAVQMLVKTSNLSLDGRNVSAAQTIKNSDRLAAGVNAGPAHW